MKEILISLATALATAVGGTLVAWLLSRVRSGRLARTLDQATKIIEFVERWSAAYDGLTKLSEANRNDAEKLMLDAMQAVREDLTAERAVLPEFGKTTSSVRSALLLYLPRRPIIWLPYFLFHTLLIFMLYIFVVRTVQGRWGMEDNVALLIAGVCAALVRLTVYLVRARE
jgi:hypothetical protein